jgi:hypothetical protein
MILQKASKLNCHDEFVMIEGFINSALFGAPFRQKSVNVFLKKWRKSQAKRASL